MKRRGFIQTISGALGTYWAPGALVAPRSVAALSCEAAPVATAPVAAAACKVVVNPAWANAPYREFILMAPGVAEALKVASAWVEPLGEFRGVFFEDVTPNRYELIDGEWIQIPMYHTIPA